MGITNKLMDMIIGSKSTQTINRAKQSDQCLFYIPSTHFLVFILPETHSSIIGGSCKGNR